MIKEFNIDNYYDGYKTSDINCVDLPIAAAAGHFNRNYYFFYCLCYSYILNWGNYYEDDWFAIRKSILNLLGLDFCKINADEKDELFQKVIQCIKDEYPVVFVVKYGALFYSKYYKWGTYDHGLIINDFNDEYETFGIRDREAIREHINNGVFTSDVMHRLQIDYDQLYKIWVESNKMFSSEMSIHCNTFYCIKPINEERNININDLLLKVLNQPDFQTINHFERYILDIKEKLVNKVQITNMEEENARRRYHRSFSTFFDVVKRYAFSKELENIDYININSKLDDFLKYRLEAINKLHLYLLRNMQLPDKELQNFIKQDYENFYSFKGELLNILTRSRNSAGI